RRATVPDASIVGADAIVSVDAASTASVPPTDVATSSTAEPDARTSASTPTATDTVAVGHDALVTPVEVPESASSPCTVSAALSQSSTGPEIVDGDTPSAAPTAKSMPPATTPPLHDKVSTTRG